MAGTPRREVPIARALLVLTSTVLTTLLVLRLFWATGSGSLAAVLETGPDAPADLLILTVCALGVAVTGWLGVTALIATVAALPGALGRVAARLAERLAPVAVRRAVALALGTALVAGIPTVAHADSPHPAPAATRVAPAPAPDPTFTVTGSAPAVDGAPTPTPSLSPTRATSTGAPDPAFSVTSEREWAQPSRPRPTPSLGPLGPAPRSTSATPGPTAAAPSDHVEVAGGVEVVEVVRGDSLWRIAARHLGPGATAVQIAREWPRWYAANRTVVGADPDLILVGQELTPPSDPTERAGS